MLTQMAQRIAANTGFMLIGVIISAVLLGVSLVQTFVYYMTYPEDPWYLKSIVAATAVFDTAHLALITHTMWHYLILNYNKPQNMEFLVWSLLIEALLTGTTAFLVHCFYVTRVYAVSKKNVLLTGFILLIVLAAAAMDTVWVVLSMQFKTFEELIAISPITTSINALSTAADVLITSSLCIMLHRSRTGFKRSDTMINKLILFVVNTAVLPSCCAIASLIALIASPHTLIYATFYFCIGRLYTNSFLAILNARKSIVDDTNHILMSTPSTLLNTHSSAGKKLPQNILIRIDTTQEIDQCGRSDTADDKLDNKPHTDEELTLETHDAAPYSTTKECESLEYGSGYAV